MKEIYFHQGENGGSASIEMTDTEWIVSTSYDCMDYGTGGRVGHIQGHKEKTFSVEQSGNREKMIDDAVRFIAGCAAVSPAVVYKALGNVTNTLHEEKTYTVKDDDKTRTLKKQILDSYYPNERVKAIKAYRDGAKCSLDEANEVISALWREVNSSWVIKG